MGRNAGLDRLSTVHFLGIGGVGMSGLARLMLAKNASITGSDDVESATTEQLRALGIPIEIGPGSKALRAAAHVIVSSTIGPNHPELRAARRLGIPIETRSCALSGYMRGREIIAVAGTHGKTTTTAMIATILRDAEMEPGFFVGGFVRSLGGVNARDASGSLFVTEACEAFGVLRDWQPTHCVVTNVDDDHVEHYGSEEHLREAFGSLISRAAHDGFVVVCGDDPGACIAAERSGRDVTLYGIDASNQLRASDVRLASQSSRFAVSDGAIELGHVALRLAGIHNVRNALGAIAMCLRIGVPFKSIAQSLGVFEGVDRRWQYVGEAAGVRIYDDFAHHPTEIMATLDVARAAAQGGRVIVAFSPQGHGRVRRRAEAFARALSASDLTLLLPLRGGSSHARDEANDAFTNAMRAVGARFVALDSVASLVAAALSELRAGDVLVAMGAVEASTIGSAMLSQLVGSRELPMSVGSLVPLEATLLARCVEHARERSDDVAVECGSDALTYSHLVRGAQSLARALHEAGVRPGDAVAVSLEPSVHRAVAVLAVLFARAVYTPIAADLPAARIATMLDIAQARVAVVDSGSEVAFASGCRVLRCPSHVDLGAAIDELPALDANDAVYIVFTSGTTGVPNAVVVERGALDNVAAAVARLLDLRHSSRVAQLMTFGFDVAIGDMAQALYAGATLVFPNSAAVRTGTPVARFLREREITHASFTPSLLSTVPVGAYQHLTHVLVCGEVCPQAAVDRWAPGRRFFNAYGATEAAVHSTVVECFAGELVTIGGAIDNTIAWIRDGELLLAGRGLARGYHRNDALSRERFVELMLPDGTHQRSYRTGDLARMLPGGRIEFLGRRDAQVKLHGHRIELEEIESCLHTYPGVSDAVAVVDRPEVGSARLLAFAVSTNPLETLDGSALREYMARTLPPYAVPSHCTIIAGIPLDANGKRDRAALLALHAAAPASPVHLKTPSTALEIALHDMLERALHLEGAFGIRETLESLGVDSLATAIFYQAIEERFGCELPLDAYADDQNIESLALHVERALENGLSREALGADWSSPILSGQRGYLAAWTGDRVGPRALVFLRNANGDETPLFWCFQGNEEHEALARGLGPQRPIYGMRSGFNLMEYSEANIGALAAAYAEELVALKPLGAFLLGGNCQGGTIARSIAQHLRSRGRDVDLLVLMEQGRFPAYGESAVALIFGAESEFNPYLGGGIANPDRVFAAAYPRGYSVDFVPGAHGTYFTQGNVGALASVVSELIAQKHLVQPTTLNR